MVRPPTPVTGITWTVRDSGAGYIATATTDPGRMITEARVTFRTLAPTEHRSTVEGDLVAAGAAALRSSVIDWAERCSRAHFAAAIAGGESVTFQVVADAPAEGAIEAYRAAGLALAVAEDEMTRSLDGVAAPRPPHGLRLESWNDLTSSLFFRAYDASFRDRPGFPGWNETRWRLGFTASTEFCAELSAVFVDDHDPVGFAVCWVEGTTGWIAQMGVVPAWRGRGVGDALIANALLGFADVPLEDAALHVGANNPAARSLYQRHRFRTRHKWESWRMTLS